MSVKTEPLLAVHGLHVETEAGRILVDSASFEIHAGETLAIVGESGSGKTLSALSLLGLLPKGVRAASGKAVFFGQNLLNLSENQLQKVRGKQIGMIFQEPMSALNPVVTIGVQMTEALRVHTELDRRAARNVALRALDLVQLARAQELLGRYPHELSGGMRQRVMIAAAMALEPSLLIADEPTTALDVRVQAQILALLQDLKSRFEMTLLLITHDMGVVAEVADQVLVMRHGQVEETGPVLEIFGAPQAAYTRALLAAVPSGTGKFADKVEPMGPPVLKIENLRKSFGTGGLFGSGTRLVLSDVTLSIAIGETLALVGESGSGKSTLGRAVVRLLDVDSGSILVDGEDIAAARSGRLRLLRRKVQILFQDPYASLDPPYERDRGDSGTACDPWYYDSPHGSRSGFGYAAGGRSRCRTGTPIPTPTFRRSASARRTGSSPGCRAPSFDRGRADLGARRVGPGADIAVDDGASAAARTGLSLHNP